MSNLVQQRRPLLATAAGILFSVSFSAGALTPGAFAAEPFRIGFEFNPDPHLEGQHERIVVTYPAACLDLKAQLLAKEGDLLCDSPLDCLGTFDLSIRLADVKSIVYPALPQLQGKVFSFAVVAEASNGGLLVSSIGRIEFHGAGDGAEFFFVDGARGDDVAGDGSRARPWKHLQYVIDHFVQSKRSDGSLINPNGRVQGGDALVLVGQEQDRVISVSGYFNTAPITIRADRFRQPVLQSVTIRGGKNWRFENLSFINSQGGKNQKAMVLLEGSPTVSDIVVESNYLSSGQLKTLEDWDQQVVTGVKYYGDAKRITAQHNLLENVFVGVGQSGSHCMVRNNEIRNFGGDALINGGSFNSYLNNTVLNCHALTDDWHNDGFQSHWGSNPDNSESITIAGNAFINRYPATQDARTYTPCQAYSAFEDGAKRNWLVYNNVCKMDHWWGFGLLNLVDSVVNNNTVIGGEDWNLPPGSSGWPSESWLKVTGSSNDVFNNVATDVQADNAHHNVIVDASTRELYFISWKKWDFHLKPDAPAIDQGIPDGRNDGSKRDHDTVARDSKPDLGAYEVRR